MSVLAPQKIRLGPGVALELEVADMSRIPGPRRLQQNHNERSQNRDHVEHQRLAIVPVEPVVQKPAVQVVVPELELSVDHVIKRVLERFWEQEECVDEVDDEGHELERCWADEGEHASCEKQGGEVKTQGCAVDQHADEHEADDVHLEVSPALEVEGKVVDALELVF
ncbi:hypothetical protein KL921_001882 [Ogataea angusta]|nr:hypothetical protein KL921_001882 [Ogataea angusta]